MPRVPEQNGAGSALAGAVVVARTLAARGLAAVQREATETTAGIRFRVRETSIGPSWPAGVYDGAAGVALVLSDWVRATGDPSARTLLAAVADGLAASASPRHNDASLYFGNGGTVVALLRAAGTLERVDLRDAAFALAKSLAKSLEHAAWPCSDLLYGPAGSGLALLQAYRASGDRTLLTGVRRCGAALRDAAETHADGIVWPLSPWGSAHDPQHSSDARTVPTVPTGLAHGVGGIALFLCQAANAIPTDRNLRSLRRAAERSLDALIRRDGDRASWPTSLEDPAERHHWCHGSGGLAHAYLMRHRLGDRDALVIACAAAEHLWRAVGGVGQSPAAEPACHCHGLAGTLDTLVAVARAAPTRTRWKRVAAIVNRIAREVAPGDAAADFGNTDSGYSTGTAGVVRALMLAVGLNAPAPYDAQSVVDLRRLRPPARSMLPPRSLFATRCSAPPESLPTVAAPIAGASLLVSATSAGNPRVSAAARALLRQERSRPVHEAWHILVAGLARLRSRHRSWVVPDALDPRLHLPIMRHISGLVWHGAETTSVRRHRREVVRFLAERHLLAIAYCLERVARDRATLLHGVVAGSLLSAEPLDGDPHRGGQRAIALRFTDGPQLVYKPRDVRVDWFIAGASAWNGHASAAMRMNDRLRAAGSALVPAHLIVPAGVTHGYAERLQIERTPLSLGKPDRYRGRFAGPVDPVRGVDLRSRRAADAFWGAAGALAGQLTAFGVTDQHADNLVVGRAAGDDAPRLHAMDCEVAFKSFSSVGRTQLVPALSGRIPEPADGPHTHYGLDARFVRFCGNGMEPWGLELDRQGRLHATEGPGAHIGRPRTSVVVNPDGSSGYGAHLGAVIRGFVEHWLVSRQLVRSLEAAARASLTGARARVLLKDTAAYVAALRQRELGVALAAGALAGVAAEGVEAFTVEELAQLQRLDVPAFDLELGAAQTGWICRPPAGRLLIESPPPSAVDSRWWRTVREFGLPDSLALSVGELVAFVAPKVVFDYRDDTHAVRVVRRRNDDRIQAVVELPSGPAQFRIEMDGGVTHWGLPTV